MLAPDMARASGSPRAALFQEGVPGLPGAPQDEAGLTWKFETSHVGGATGRTPPIPRSALALNQPFYMRHPCTGVDRVMGGAGS